MKSLIIIKKLIYLLKGYKLTKVNLRISENWFGYEYGGFYLHSEILNQKSIIYSLGVGLDITFDLKIIDLLNCKVFAFDPTPKSINWVKYNVFIKNFIFSPYGISKSFINPKIKII